MTSTTGTVQACKDSNREELKYRRNWELREEMCHTVGVETSRYSRGSNRSLTKEHLYAIARSLGDVPDELTIGELYRWFCDEAGVDYNENAGNQWRLGRKQLKALYLALQPDTRD